MPIVEFTQTFRNVGGELVTNYSQLVVNDPTNLPPAMVGAVYTEKIDMIGGTEPYVMTVTIGTLPDGLAFDGDTITGTPTQTEQPTFTVGITDDDGWQTEKQFIILVVPALEITTGGE